MCTVGGMRRETAHRWTPSNTRVLASRVMVIDTGGPNHPTRNAARVDRVIDISQQESEHTMRELARVEGIFCGVSSGGAIAAALRLSAEVEDAVIAAIICDRGDRYLSTGVFAG